MTRLLRAIEHRKCHRTIKPSTDTEDRLTKYLANTETLFNLKHKFPPQLLKRVLIEAGAIRGKII